MGKKPNLPLKLWHTNGHELPHCRHKVLTALLIRLIWRLKVKFKVKIIIIN